MATKEVVPKDMWKHRVLTGRERSNFIGLYRQTENKHKVFQFIKNSNITMLLWTFYIFIFGIYSILHSGLGKSLYNLQYSTITYLGLFVLGIICLQIVFITSHVESHALFLEYESHYPNSKQINKYPIYYYAFYHHHHTVTDNWAPYLSYYNLQGMMNIVAAHWHGYTLLGSNSIFLVITSIYICPPTSLYFLGYEIGTLLLPFAHMWQHVPHDPNNIVGHFFNNIFKLLEKIGLFANGEDHSAHHVHNWPTVYRDFSSSGLYMKYFDKQINKFWDKSFYYALRNNKKPYDIIGPYADMIYEIMFLLIPATINLVVQCIKN